LPFLLAVFRGYRDKGIKLKVLKQSLAAVENYHFKVTAIATRSSSGGISEMYASHARQIYRSRTPQERVQCVADLIAKLKGKEPSEAEFVEAFAERLYFTNDARDDKDLVRYVLSKLHLRTVKGPAPDFSKYTIEHITPQTRLRVNDPERVGYIGNLLLVEETLNAELDDKAFKEKKKILRKHSTRYDLGDVLGASVWTPQEIAKRAQRLARVAFRRTWS